MNAQRIIFKDDDTQEVLFDEKCLCGNPEISIEKNKPTFATCKVCLRVIRRMYRKIPEGRIEIWGVYFDPYLANTIVGQFIEPLDKKRYPIND